MTTSKKPTHKPLSTKPMTLGNAVRELYSLVMCDCPGIQKSTKVTLKARLKISLMLDMEFHSAGAAPSKKECEEMVYGAPEGTPSRAACRVRCGRSSPRW